MGLTRPQCGEGAGEAGLLRQSEKTESEVGTQRPA